jgi:hypothetical protein
MEQASLLTVRQLVEKHRAFSENQIRWIIFHREKNGFAHCFLKMGKKRILVDENAFFAQLEKGRMGVAA